MLPIQTTDMATVGGQSRTEDPLDYEETHVHKVYESIASHFNSTRYKPWPVVDAFIRALPPGSIGLDVGCGNGKYLGVNRDVFILGSDRSANLISLAHRNQISPSSVPASTNSTGPNPNATPNDVITADTLSLPHPPHTFDFAISIAVIHHFSSPIRRIAAIRSILDKLLPPPATTTTTSAAATHTRPSCTFPRDALPSPPTPGKGPGQALLFVWALEQSTSRRGWSEGMEQDVLVPWVLNQPATSSRRQKTADSVEATVSLRPTTAADATGATTDASRSDKTSTPAQQSGAHDTGEKGEQPTPQTATGDKVFNRYYHLYAQGELERECEAAGGRVIGHGYDRDNWWVVVEPAQTQREKEKSGDGGESDVMESILRKGGH